MAHAQNTVNIVEGSSPIKYNNMIFGHFIEHFDTQIYGGIFDPNSKFADEDGFRTDVIEALKQIKVPIVRWPGGCFAETYHWRDGIGKNRPVRPNWWGFADGKYEPNEVFKTCRQI